MVLTLRDGYVRTSGNYKIRGVEVICNGRSFTVRVTKVLLMDATADKLCSFIDVYYFKIHKAIMHN